MVVVVEDRADSASIDYSLKTAHGRVRLKIDGEPPSGLLTGARVRLHGKKVGHTLEVSSAELRAALAEAAANNPGSAVTTNAKTSSSASPTPTVTPTPSPGATTTSGPLPNTFGAQSTLVILVNFQDDPTNQPWTPSQVQSAVFGSAGANGFMQENSYQQSSVTGDVYGWYTIPLNSTSCYSSLIASYANSAASSAGANLSSYSHYVYVFPYDSACGWGGAAQIGGNEAWMNGTIDPNTFAHELGHNFGLYHSHGLYCGNAVIGTNCTTVEYGNVTDTMGIGFGDFDAFQKEQLGWVNYGASPPITRVDTSGAYTIDPYETIGTNPKALKILQSIDPTTGLRTWYYVEYRQPLGFDQALLNYNGGSNNFTQGVVVSLGTDSTPNSSDQLDMNPNNTTSDVALTPGETFSDSNAGVTITTQWANSTNAGVNVTLTTPCTHANPTVAISPTQGPAASAGTPETYAVTVTNNDNNICAASSFNLAAAVASGWSAAFGSSSLSLNPGATGSTSLTVTSPASTVAGSYSVGVSAQNSSASGYEASASATYEVAPSVAVSTSSPSYKQGGSVYVTVAVNSGGSSVSGDSVNCTVTGPGGTKMSATGTTGTNGSTMITFKLKRNAPTGTYQALGVAAVNGVSGSGATNFTVQ
jgi:hypothetical protein